MKNPSNPRSTLLTLACVGLLSSAPLAGVDLLGSEDMGPAFQPAVIAMTPMAGPAGTLVTIRGTNLSRVSRVMFSPNLEAKEKVVSDIMIQVTVPVGAISGPVTLETLVGTVKPRVTFSIAN